LEALLPVRVNVPDTSPKAVGLNVTLIVHLAFTASEALQVFAEIAKGGVAAAVKLLIVPEPVLLTVTFLAVLIVSMGCSPKFSEVGLGVMIP
jgi:hypothetical protein